MTHADFGSACRSTPPPVGYVTSDQELDGEVEAARRAGDPSEGWCTRHRQTEVERPSLHDRAVMPDQITRI